VRPPVPAPHGDEPLRATMEALVYELLDAHSDTANLAAELEWSGDPSWRTHLDYLRALQRTGREALAHFGTQSVA
jgi:hypothetical protein